MVLANVKVPRPDRVSVPDAFVWPLIGADIVKLVLVADEMVLLVPVCTVMVLDAEIAGSDVLLVPVKVPPFNTIGLAMVMSVNINVPVLLTVAVPAPNALLLVEPLSVPAVMAILAA